MTLWSYNIYTRIYNIDFDFCMISIHLLDESANPRLVKKVACYTQYLCMYVRMYVFCPGSSTFSVTRGHEARKTLEAGGSVEWGYRWFGNHLIKAVHKLTRSLRFCFFPGMAGISTQKIADTFEPCLVAAAPVIVRTQVRSWSCSNYSKPSILFRSCIEESVWWDGLDDAYMLPPVLAVVRAVFRFSRIPRWRVSDQPTFGVNIKFWVLFRGPTKYVCMCAFFFFRLKKRKHRWRRQAGEGGAQLPNLHLPIEAIMRL